jgi:hypothetical protein
MSTLVLTVCIIYTVYRGLEYILAVRGQNIYTSLTVAVGLQHCALLKGNCGVFMYCKEKYSI